MRVVEAGPVAFRVNPRVVVLGGFAAVALAVLSILALMLGDAALSPGEVLRALFGKAEGGAAFIVRTLRLPRLLVGIAVGWALAGAGAIFQGIVRNPLVSPDIIGINAGASVAAVFWIVSGFPLAALPAVAFGGALVAGAAVYLLSWRGRIAPARLILVGIGVNAIFTAGVTLFIVRGGINEVSRAYQWMAGSLYASNWADVRLLLAGLAVLVPAGTVLMRSLRVMQLGDLVARSVGMPLERLRLALLAVGCALSAFAVSATGPIGFVALMVPHVARMLAGPMTGGVFIFCGVLGGILVTGSDLIGQNLLPVLLPSGVALPVGVVTAALGAPYFLYLLYRSSVRI